MTEASDTESNEEERPVFCPYNRESLIASEARIAEEEAKKNELKKKREEGEVSFTHTHTHKQKKIKLFSFSPLLPRH